LPGLLALEGTTTGAAAADVLRLLICKLLWLMAVDAKPLLPDCCCCILACCGCCCPCCWYCCLLGGLGSGKGGSTRISLSAAAGCPGDGKSGQRTCFLVNAAEGAAAVGAAVAVGSYSFSDGVRAAALGMATTCTAGRRSRSSKCCRRFSVS
jgi:hypothetical protein